MKRILLLLIIALILAACSNGDSDPPPPPAEPSPYFGTELKLSGDVYMRDINFDFENIEVSILYLLTGSLDPVTYRNADTNIDLSISDGGLGGSGRVKNGKFSYSIGIPADEYFVSIDELFSNISLFPGVVDLPNIGIEIPSIDARAVYLNLLIADDPEYFFMTRENIGFNQTLLTISSEIVSYIYINKTVTISVPASTYDTVVMDIPIRLNVSSIYLNLKEGWNAIHSTLAIPLMSMLDTPTGNLEIVLGNPSSHKWVLNSGDGESFPFP
jgi:hypothetical protein